jgi:ABC-type dipeptide/oligopeptide/nickel transport system ATPase component
MKELPPRIRSIHPFFQSWYRRTHYENKNVYSVAVGQVGSGKSYTAMSIGCLLDPDFNIDNIAFTPTEFLSAMDVASKRKKHGQVIIFDEMGVGMASRSYMSIQNRLTSEFLQTARHLRLISIFTVPTMGFIDKQARLVVHNILRISRHQDNPPKIHPLLSSVNPLLEGKDYNYAPRGVIGEKWVKFPEIIWDVMPPKELLKAYEEKAGAWKDKLRKDNLALFEQMEKAEQPKVDFREVLPEILMDSEPLLNKFGLLDWMLIKNKYDNLSQRDARLLAKLGDKELDIK